MKEHELLSGEIIRLFDLYLKTQKTPDFNHGDEWAEVSKFWVFGITEILD